MSIIVRAPPKVKNKVYGCALGSKDMRHNTCDVGPDECLTMKPVVPIPAKWSGGHYDSRPELRIRYGNQAPEAADCGDVRKFIGCEGVGSMRSTASDKEGEYKTDDFNGKATHPLLRIVVPRDE